MGTINAASKTLKSENFGWLCTLMMLDLVVMCALVVPGLIETATTSRIVMVRSVTSVLLPIMPLLLVHTLPHLAKARLVFWRWSYPNPGSRAFSVYLYRDDRINAEQLRKNVGAFPSEPREQNARWFSLYKQSENEASVLDAHKSFLLYRDIATVSFLLLIITAVAFPLFGFSGVKTGQAIFVLATQYFLAAAAGRFTGERFICTVLALHSLKKPRAPSNRSASKLI